MKKTHIKIAIIAIIVILLLLGGYYYWENMKKDDLEKVNARIAELNKQVSSEGYKLHNMQNALKANPTADNTAKVKTQEDLVNTLKAELDKLNKKASSIKFDNFVRG